MFMVLLAAQVAVPSSLNPSRWVSPSDVPHYLANGPSGVWYVSLRIDVGADGRIQDCQGELQGPVPQLNVYTCKLIRHRAKFRPALIDGVPIAGVYRTVISYAVADRPVEISDKSPADVEVTVDRLPPGMKSPVKVSVAFTVDPTGAKSSCGADQSGRVFRSNNHPALVQIACAEVLEGYRAIPAVNAGQPITSVQNASVRFTASGSAASER